MFLPEIYPITDTLITNLPHDEQVKILIKGGAEFIQLREKRASSRDFYFQAEKAIEFARKRGAKIIINDRVDIALALKADGVHLGQDDLPPVEARKILGEQAIIGFSTHTPEQAARGARLPVDYIAVGPVFATETKENPEKVVGLEGLKKAREAVGNFPLVAIGGINPRNFREVFSNGADCLAIIGGILSPPEKIIENLRRFSP